MTLNSYLYSTPDVVERLTQGQRMTVDAYRNRAAGHIMEFERKFYRDGMGQTKYQARI
jgi:hypothetical protein